MCLLKSSQVGVCNLLAARRNASLNYIYTPQAKLSSCSRPVASSKDVTRGALLLPLYCQVLENSHVQEVARALYMYNETKAALRTLRSFSPLPRARKLRAQIINQVIHSIHILRLYYFTLYDDHMRGRFNSENKHCLSPRLFISLYY